MIRDVWFKACMIHRNDYDEKLNQLHNSHWIHQSSKYGIHQCTNSLSNRWMLKNGVLYKTLMVIGTIVISVDSMVNLKRIINVSMNLNMV